MLLTILLAFILVAAGWAKGDLSVEATLAQIFFVCNYYSLNPNSVSSVEGIGILWSLAVEEHFYLIWPAIFLFIARGKIGLRHLFWLLFAILVWRCVRFFVLGDTHWEIYISTDTRFDSLLYGCLLALLIARGDVPAWVHRPHIFYPTLIVCFLLLVATFLWRDPAFRSTIRYTMQGIALMPIFFYATQRSDNPLFYLLNTRAIRRIGVYSYTPYLVHFVILYALWNTGFSKGEFSTVLLAASLSLIWAALVYRFAEQPLHGLRARLNTLLSAQS